MNEKSPPTFSLIPIGTIWTGFKTLSDCPHNSRFNDRQSRIELNAEFTDGLKRLEIATHLVVLYWLDQADRSKLQTIPPHSNESEPLGVFALRSPHRPNPVALSTVEIIKVDGNIITVSGLDCVDGTALIDLKPYVPMIDGARTAEFKLDSDNMGQNNI